MGIGSRSLFLIAAYALMAFSGTIPSCAFGDELVDRRAYWESKALMCDAGEPDHVHFPTKQTNNPAQPCNDGDMTLFNGLLCAAGDERGCIGVAEAQDSISGQWFRSPRIRRHGNDRGGADFSPDMALGVQLYLIAKKDAARAKLWLDWLQREIPCAFSLFGNCLIDGTPRFCAPDQGCTMRPGDLALLATTVNYLQHNAGLPDLPSGRLRGLLGTFSGYSAALAELDAQFNKPGFSQHLVGVTVMALRAAGASDSRLDSAVVNLVAKNPGNAFFTYLKIGISDETRSEVLARCPAPDKSLVKPLDEWQWERDNASQAWEHSSYWDCIFMGRLLEHH